MTRIDLVGDAKERGFAHGALMAKEIFEFVRVKLPVFYANMFAFNFLKIILFAEI
jgi:hypothetical protein